MNYILHMVWICLLNAMEEWSIKLFMFDDTENVSQVFTVNYILVSFTVLTPCNPGGQQAKLMNLKGRLEV